MKRTVFAIVLMLLVFSILTTPVCIQQAKAWTGTVYISGDGSVDPPTAPIQRDGDIYTFTDNINGSIVVQGNIIVVDGAGYSLQGSGGGTGIDLTSRYNVTIKNIKIKGFSTGIRLADGSQQNNITGNDITNNYYGISPFYTDSHYNYIIGNNITNNEFGISLTRSHLNRFYHNNFVNNTKHFVVGSYIEVWDDGYPSGGNYWSDYWGVDEKSGPYQNETGSDGIGDTPYFSDAYPLMNFYGVVPIYPIPVFNYSPNNQIAQQPVVFNASDSTCPNGTITDYRWNFGDGTYEMGKIVSHIYNSYGNYNVTLTLVSNTGSRSYQNQVVTVRKSPVASFTFSPPCNPSVGQHVTFDASSSNPLGGTITNNIWNFGDGNITSTNDSLVVHIYASQNVFNVTLTVLDSEDLNSSYSKTINIMMPTSVSISTSSSSTFIGFAVNINGTLHDFYRKGLENEPVIILYTFLGTSAWFPISSGITDYNGNYYVQWIPSASGYFTIRAEWAGNTTHFGASSNITLSSLPYQNQYVFTVESNSTISALTFNSTSLELGFKASGPNGTRGYSKVTFAKKLVANATDIKVYVDGNLTEYSVTSLDDSWLITLDYIHSTRNVVVTIPEFQSLTILPIFMILAILTLVFTKQKPSRKPHA